MAQPPPPPGLEREQRHPARQLPLNLPHAPGLGHEDFFVSVSNEKAYAAIEAWPAWPDPALILIGPAGSGKTHLGAIWVARAEGQIRPAATLASADIEALARAGPLLIEDAEAAGQAQTELFHLLNLMRERAAPLLLTARRPPDAWGLDTADLLSRLRLAPCVEIGAPDDALMRAVLVKLLVDRQLFVDIRVVEYAVLRLERSLDAARKFVEALDREALSRQSRISRQMAADVLSGLGSAAGGCEGEGLREEQAQGPT
jgi:chromosomal replication initiation ATPase DnaA